MLGRNTAETKDCYDPQHLLPPLRRILLAVGCDVCADYAVVGVMKKRVLIGCEFSGIVREAFNAYSGIEAVSCDLLPPEDGRVDCHIQGDVRDVLSQGWDLGIFFPPCTFLCNSGVRWLFDSSSDAINAIRWEHMLRACNFFNALLAAPIKRIAIENPIHHCHARERIIKYDQIIHPWQFGRGETKATCLWLRNLPKLQPTNIVNGRKPRVHYASPGADRWKERSRTLPGIAAAMAAQWSAVLFEYPNEDEVLKADLMGGLRLN